MSRLLANCVEYFNTDNLYQVLGVTKEASPQDVKKGYHRKSLLYHPDRVKPEDKDLATKKFQALAQVHSILSDDGKRAEYDETGTVDEELAIDQDRDWEQYWRLLFPKITQQDIEDFAEKYKGSEEEVLDLKAAYLASEGDMDAIMDQMMCSTFEDEPRFQEALENLIQDRSLPAFKAFTKETKKKKGARMKKAQSEAKEAEEEAKKLKLGQDEASLMSLIASRQASRAKQADDFFSQMEAKYCKGGKKKPAKKSK